MTIAANPDRSVFYGFAGWVGRVTSPTECAFWPEDPNDPTIAWNQHKLIGVNLGRNPSAHRANQIQRDQIEVDDHPLLGGNTHLGPTFPTGKMMGPVFLESRFWDRLKPHGNRPPRAPTGGQCFDYD